MLDDIGDLNQGFHNVYVNDSLLNVVAVNIEIKESEPSFYSTKDLEKYADAGDGWQFVDLKNQKDVENFLQSDEIEPYPLWKYCVILALIFLFIEVVLIRLS